MKLFNQVLDFVPKLPIAELTDRFTKWLTNTFSFIFDPINKYFGSLIDFLSKDVLTGIPPIYFMLFVAIIAFFASGRKWGLAVFSIISLWLIYNQGHWDNLMNTLTLVLIASLLSVMFGIPVGILMSKSKIANAVISPVLDFMQTMPAFVYLIPAVAFFGIGMVPGVFASVIFATPPIVRLTNLGIRNVSKELVEAADAFGSTGWQKLIKVELPMAKSTIMAGINQTVMLALSMVVIASMIGARGLGREVLTSLQRANVGTGFVAGIAIVILAIIIDRITQNINKKEVS